MTQGKHARPGQVQIQVRVPEELHVRLQRTADERVVSVNLLVTKAIESFLDRLPPMSALEVPDDRRTEPM